MAGPMIPGFVYEIDVDGQLGEAPLANFGDLRVESRGWHTVVRGPLPDEGALHTVLDQIRALGLAVLQFRRHGPEYDRLEH
jgi:hypothetical protein